MRRLRLRRGWGWGLKRDWRRPGDERGAVAVVVALLMVPLIGFAAISIDVAAMWSERQELQTGADAGALAVARDCARDACANTTDTAQTLAAANVSDEGVTASVDASGVDQVSVTTSGVRQHLFAPVLGINSSTIVAHSRAGWGSPDAGTAELPLAISWCDFQAQTGGSLTSSLPGARPLPTVGATAGTLLLSSVARAAAPTQPATTCVGPRGNPVPTGFGWLETGRGTCQATSSIAAGGSSAGASLPGACSSADFQRLRSGSVMLPIFDGHSGSPGGGAYRVYGYAAFTITGYHFAGQLDSGSPCAGSDSCISGFFTRSVDLSDRFTYAADAPRLGAAVVSLTQ